MRLQNAATATGNGAGISTLDFATVAFQVSGTFVGTVAFEATVNGSTWVGMTATDSVTGTSSATATATGIYRADCAAFAHARTRVSAYTSGSITVDAEVSESGAGGAGRDATEATLASVLTAAQSILTELQGTLDVTQAQLRRTQDAVSASGVTDVLMNGDTALTPKFAAIAAATSGANTLVAAVTAKKLRVLALVVVAGAAGNIYFTSAAAGAVIFGGSTNKINLAINGGFVLPYNPLGWFETVAGELLNLNASSTGPFAGGLCYVEV